MNISHRSLWNASLGAWVAVSEVTRACGKRTLRGTASVKTPLTGPLCPLNTALILAGLLAASGSVIAQSTDWNAGGAGNWNTGARWSQGVPTAGTVARLTVGDQITLSSSGTAQSLEIESPGEVIVTTGGALTIGDLISLGRLNGGVGVAKLTIQGGGTVSALRLFAGDGTQPGNVTVTGAGSSLTVAPSGLTGSYRFQIGGLGAGELHIDAGANVTVNGTRTLHLGLTGNGALFIGNGAGAGTLTADSVIFGTTGSSVQLNHTGTTTFTAAISGNGFLTKTGAGTTTLTGANTYTGGTSINAGTLALGAGGSLAATGLVTLSAPGTGFNISASGNQTIGALAGVVGSTVSLGATILTLGGINDQTFGGMLSGTGGLVKQGTGTQTLTGANTYSGGTALNAGTLTLGNNGALGGGALTVGGASTLDNNTALNLGNNITLNAGLTVGGSNALTLGGPISGTGSLSKTGAATLTLTGANTYTGGTSISAGTLALGAGGSLAATSAVNVSGAGAGFDISAGGNQTIGALAGVVGSAVSLGANTLTFGTASDQTFAGAIGDSGGLVKRGAGTQILSGISSYSGATTVAAGLLSVNGAIANSQVTVNSGATLGGSGTVGSTTIASGGILAPGNSIGTLTVNGNLNFTAGSVYRVEVDAAGNNDRTNVTGTATLNGGTVDVQASAGTYAANTTYTLLNATGGRTGAFSGVTSNLAFLTPTLGYDANNVFLSLARNDISFSAVAVTPNQIAISTALQHANAGATGDMGTVQTALTGLSAEQARAAYDSAGGAGLATLRNAGASFAAGFGNQLQARLGAVQGGGSGLALSNRPVLLAANDRVSDVLAPVYDTPQKFSLAGGGDTSSGLPSRNDPSKGFWLRGSGGYQTTHSDGNASASQVRSGSISAGLDAELHEGLRAGIALSNGASRLSTDNNESGKSRSTALALYGSYVAGPWAFKGSASVGRNKNQMDRVVTVGAINRTASSDFDSTTLSAYGEAAYSLAMNGGWTLQPLAALSLSRNKADGFTETGAGALNLQVAGQTTNSTQSLLGAKAAFDAGKLRLEPRVLWAHEFGNLNAPMTAQFQGAANASPFQVSGVALKRDTLILGLGASGSVSKNFDLFADVQAEHNSLQRNVAVLVGLRGRW
jgi:outer membrane autotransporter protein